jgi:hypothetical protein
VIALAAATALPVAAPASPASKQYKDNLPPVPNSGGGGSNGGAGGGENGAKGGGKGGGEGKNQGKNGGKKNGTESGALASLNDSDDGGGISTIAIILIILAVAILGAGGVMWLRSRQSVP